VALLESDQYETEDQLAFAVLKEAVEILTDRHLFVAFSRQYPHVGFGPYFTEAQAEKAWRMEIAPVVGTEGGTLLRIAPWPATPAVHEDKDYHPAAPCMCGHPRWKHTNSGKRGYCGNRKDACRCGGFTRAAS